MLGLDIAKMAIRTPSGLLPLLPSPRVRVYFYPCGTSLPPENFEKIGVVWVYSEALETWSAASLQFRLLFSSGRSSPRRTVARMITDPGYKLLVSGRL